MNIEMPVLLFISSIFILKYSKQQNVNGINKILLLLLTFPI